MDKVILNVEQNTNFFDYTKTVMIGDTAIQVRNILRQHEREMLAMDISTVTLIFDEKSGLVYEGYNRDVMRMMCMLRYYTNLDVEPYDTAEGHYLLYDMLAATGVLEQIIEITHDDMEHVQKIFELLKESAQRVFEHTHTLPFQIQQSFASVLNGEDLSETLAKASTVNNQMVDMLGAFRREQMAKPSVGGNIVRFDKRDK